MKIRIFSLSICFLLSNMGRAQSSISEYLELMKTKEVASFDIDLNNDGELDNIKFKFPATSEHPEFSYSDPGVCNILEITISNGESFLLEEAFDSLPGPIRNNVENKLESSLVFLTKPLNGSSYLIISGPEYGCCLPKLFIFRVVEDYIEEVYSDEFDVNKFFYDSTTDKYLVEGRTFIGEVWDSYRTEYYFEYLNYVKVYSLQSTFKLDPEETRKINQKNIAKFGDFVDLKNPVIVTNKQTNEQVLISYEDEIRFDYQLKYDDLYRSKLDLEYFDKFSDAELRIMRNEVFASCGYIFDSHDLQEYFSSKKWYKPSSKNIENKLTEIEQYNIQLILEAEKARK